MVDNPHQFVCDFVDLQAGRRITALPAEEDLELGGVYVLLPMQKYLRRVLSPSDMTSLNLLAFQCNSGDRKLSCNSKIWPILPTGSSYEFCLEKGNEGSSDQLKEKVADLEVVVPKLAQDTRAYELETSAGDNKGVPACLQALKAKSCAWLENVEL